MKKQLFILPVLLLFIAISGCNNYGKEKIFNGVELYHTDKVTDAEADQLGNYLVTGKFADGREKTVQLTKFGNVYQFRMVIKDGIDKDPQYAKIAKFLATMISAQVFNGAPVEVHLCDEYLKTLKVVTADDYGKEKRFNGADVFHTKNITDAEVDSLGNYLVRSKFTDGNEKSLLITKTGNTYQFKLIVKSGIEKDPSYIENGKIFASQLSKDVFKNAPVEVAFCDDYFNILVSLPMKAQ